MYPNGTAKTRYTVMSCSSEGACLLGLKMLRSWDPSRLGLLDDSRDARLPDLFFSERVGVLGADSEPMNLKGVAASDCREEA